MTELEIMERAKMYIDSLAHGFDPLSGKPVSNDDVVRQVRISKCLNYVSNVLQKVIDNGGEVQRSALPKGEKVPFSLTYEQMSALVPDSKPLSSSKVTALINAQIDELTMLRLKTTTLNNWLVTAGLLKETVTEAGNKRKVPTEQGRQIGMTEADFINEKGVKTKYIVYSAEAQQFIFDNIDQIAELAVRENEEHELLKKQKQENAGKPWSPEEDSQLEEMFINGMTTKEIAEQLCRSRGAINARLIKFGLIAN